MFGGVGSLIAFPLGTQASALTILVAVHPPTKKLIFLNVLTLIWTLLRAGMGLGPPVQPARSIRKRPENTGLLAFRR
jgi:hypothetical protein